MTSIVCSLIFGVKDSVSVHQFLLLFFTSRQVRNRTIQCFLLNGLLFLGSIFAMNNLISPLVFTFLTQESSHKLNTVGGYLTDALFKLYGYIRYTA
jgi:etoposide-induced 2.4 mRNA